MGGSLARVLIAGLLTATLTSCGSSPEQTDFTGIYEISRSSTALNCNPDNLLASTDLFDTLEQAIGADVVPSAFQGSAVNPAAYVLIRQNRNLVSQFFGTDARYLSILTCPTLSACELYRDPNGASLLPFWDSMVYFEARDESGDGFDGQDDGPMRDSDCTEVQKIARLRPGSGDASIRLDLDIRRRQHTVNGDGTCTVTVSDVPDPGSLPCIALGRLEGTRVATVPPLL